MSINKDSQKAPNLRFKGFTDDWEQRKLENLVTRVKSYSLSRSVETNSDTNTKYIHYGDIHTHVADKIEKDTKLPNIIPGDYETLNKGDLVLADASEDYQGIATPAIVMTQTDYSLVAGLHTIALRPIKIDSLYLYYLIKSSTFRKYGYKVGTGMKVFGISVNRLLEFKAFMPITEEQSKIAELLLLMDKSITLHQRKLDQLNQLKQALLQQMFPGKGETVPKLRFAGFEGDWEERKLGSIYDFSKGKGLPLNSFTYSKDNPAIAYGHLYTKYSEVISEVYLSSDDDGVLSKENDLLFPGSSTVPNGTAQANAIMLNNVKLGGDIIIARPKQDIRVLSIFMSYQINSQRQKLFPITVGTTIAHMYGKDLSKVKFFITNYSEQEKISDVFKQLDNTISGHQRKLDQLKNMKQVLLQNMFI